MTILKTAARETNISYVLSQIRHQGRGGYGQGGGGGGGSDMSAL